MVLIYCDDDQKALTPCALVTAAATPAPESGNEGVPECWSNCARGIVLGQYGGLQGSWLSEDRSGLVGGEMVARVLRQCGKLNDI